MYEIIIWALILTPIFGWIAVIVFKNTNVTCPICSTTYWFNPNKCKKCGYEFVKLQNKFAVDFDKKFWVKFSKRLFVFCILGAILVTLFFPGDNIFLVRAGNAPLNKYLYAIGASAILALLTGKNNN
jgi:uncharacterized RDD family membrane protein YckC